MRLSFVRLLVSNFPASFRFYREVMGFAPVWGEENGVYAEFDTGMGTRLAISAKEVVSQVIGTADADSTLPAQDRFQVIFELPADQLGAVDKFAEALKAKGVDILHGPTDMAGWGVRVVIFRDVDGYLLEINQMLSAG